MPNVPSVSDYLTSYSERQRLASYEYSAVPITGASESDRRAQVSTLRVDAYRSTYYAPTASAPLAASVLTGAYDSGGQQRNAVARSGGYFTAVI